MDSIDAVLLPDANATGLYSHQVTSGITHLLTGWSLLVLLVVLSTLYAFRKSSKTTPSKRNQVVKTVRFEDEYQGSKSEAVKSQLVGTWHLVSYQLNLESPIRVTRNPFGDEPKGRLIYTPDGYMSVNMMQPGCEPFRATNPHGGTTQENSSAAAHYMAYSGRYETYEHQGQKMVNHMLDTSLYPNWLSADQTRICEIEGDELVLRPKDMPTFLGMKVGGILRWRKA